MPPWERCLSFIAMSKSTIQNWNAKSQIRNPKCQGVMGFQRSKEPVCNAKSRSEIQTASLQCKIEIRDPNSQFAMQNRNKRSKQPVCNAKSKSEPVCNAESKSVIQTASSQCRIETREPNGQFGMQNRNQRSKQPVCNAKSKSGMVMMHLHWVPGIEWITEGPRVFFQG